MKKFILTVALLVMILFCSRMHAQVEEKTTGAITTADSVTGKTTLTDNSKVQEPVVHSDMMTINPLEFLYFYNISYYHALTPNITVGGGVHMPAFTTIRGFGINAEMRYYVPGKCLHGFYIAPNVSYKHIYSTTASTDVVTDILSQWLSEEKIDMFLIGGLVGWQWFPGDDFVNGDFIIGLGLGVDKYFVNSYSSIEGSSSDDSILLPAFRFNFGYAW